MSAVAPQPQPPVVSRSTRGMLAVGALLLPLAGLVLLIAAPGLDFTWENHPSHFWLVLAAGALNFALAYATGAAARRRGDARVFLVSLAFLSAAGFLSLHALATPGVLLDQANTGFVVATPVGLFAASIFAAASGVDLSGGRGAAVMRRAGLLQGAVLVALVVWGALSLSGAPPLDDPRVPERATGTLLIPAIAAVGLYGYAVYRYLRLYAQRPLGMMLWMAAAFALLAEANIAVAIGRNWHATWWEWHLLMLVAFSLVAWSAHRQWHEERFSDLYVLRTEGGVRDVSVLFADLSGFTSFAERHEPEEVTAMLNQFFEVAIPPVVRRHGGAIDRLVGDAMMVTFNTRSDQPDHAERAARAALAIQQVAAEVIRRYPDWPRFRVGVNSGEAAVSILGTSGGRTQTVVGDVVNTASRLEAEAPVGGVAIGSGTADRLIGADLQTLGAVQVKGKSAPIQAFRLLGIPDGE